MYSTAKDLLAKAGPLNNLSDETKQALLVTCAAVGAMNLAKAGGDLLYGVWKHLLRPRRNLLARYAAKDGSQPWAVVTGGADGLGLAYCKQLAAEGFNICVIDKDTK